MATTYAPIATYTFPNSTTTNIDFTGISQSYTDIRLEFYGSLTNAGTDINMNVNNITSGVYKFRSVYTTSNATGLFSNNYNSYTYLRLNADMWYSSIDANNRLALTVDIMDYSRNGSFGHGGIIRSGISYNSGANQYGGVGVSAFNIDDSTNISSIKVSAAAGYFVSGSKVTLFGIARA